MTRNEAIDALKANYPDARYSELREAVDLAVEALEEPERRKGEWKKEWNYFFHVDLPVCSYCLEFSSFKYDFCPRCGADMREMAKVNDRT